MSKQVTEEVKMASDILKEQIPLMIKKMEVRIIKGCLFPDYEGS